MIEPRIEALRAEGRAIIPVYGYPVVSPPEHVISAAAEAARSTTTPPSNGIRELREGVGRVLDASYGGSVDPNAELLVTAGAMHGLRIVFTTLLGPGDEALLLTPSYFFSGLIDLTGARTIRIETTWANGLAIDFDRLRASITPRTKILILSSPVNPTGAIYSRSDVQQFLALAEEFNILLVTDESYDRMIFDGAEHISPFHWPEGRRRTILIKSFTKSYALPGWRVGYVAADKTLIPYFRKVLEWSMLYCPFVNQKVALAALEGPQGWLLKIFREIEHRRGQLMEGLAAAERYRWIRPQGGPFLFLEVCGENGDDAAIAEQLLMDFGVPAVPGRHFHGPGHVRIPYGGTVDAVDRLVNALVEASRQPVGG